MLTIIIILLLLLLLHNQSLPPPKKKKKKKKREKGSRSSLYSLDVLVQMGMCMKYYCACSMDSCVQVE